MIARRAVLRAIGAFPRLPVVVERSHQKRVGKAGFRHRQVAGPIPSVVACGEDDLDALAGSIANRLRDQRVVLEVQRNVDHVAVQVRRLADGVRHGPGVALAGRLAAGGAAGGIVNAQRDDVDRPIRFAQQDRRHHGSVIGRWLEGGAGRVGGHIELSHKGAAQLGSARYAAVDHGHQRALSWCLRLGRDCRTAGNLSWPNNERPREQREGCPKKPQLSRPRRSNRLLIPPASCR